VDVGHHALDVVLVLLYEIELASRLQSLVKVVRFPVFQLVLDTKGLAIDVQVVALPDELAHHDFEQEILLVDELLAAVKAAQEVSAIALLHVILTAEHVGELILV